MKNQTGLPTSTLFPQTHLKRDASSDAVEPPLASPALWPLLGPGPARCAAAAPAAEEGAWLASMGRPMRRLNCSRICWYSPRFSTCRGEEGGGCIVERGGEGRARR